MWFLKSIGLCLQRRRCLKMLTDGRRSHWYTNSSPQNFGSGELKSCQDLEAPPTLQNCLDPHIDLMRIRVPFFQSFICNFRMLSFSDKHSHSAPFAPLPVAYHILFIYCQAPSRALHVRVY